MQRQRRMLFWLIVSVAAASGGYIWWDHARTDVEEELEQNLTQLKDPVVQPLKPTTTPPNKLQLKLQSGEVFPLVKTIDETITQKTDAGPVKSHTRVQLWLAIRVESVEANRKKFRVDYRRVIYEQDVAGEKIYFDSRNTQQPIPTEVRAYSGLVGNGFAFWLGANNQIETLEDFPEFLKRCVKDVPPEQRQEVMTRFMQTSGDEGVANFIDDSIALLPERKKTVQIGDTWVRSHSIQRPIPLFVTQTCKLIRLDKDVAEFDVTGRIAPAAEYGPSGQPNHGLQLTVRSGHIDGSCRVHSQTGLPEHSRIRRIYDMIVTFPDGRQFQQTKDATTIIEVFSQQGEPKTIGHAEHRIPALLPAPSNGTRRTEISQLSANRSRR